MAISIYQEKCLRQIASLSQRMQAIGDNKDREWLRLRAQKIAYEKRLRDRTKVQTAKDQIALRDAIIALLSQEALKMAPKASLNPLKAALERETSKRIGSFLP